MTCKYLKGELCGCGLNHFIGGICEIQEQCSYYEESFTTKDSGNREVFDSGMQRDTTEGKMRPDLMFPEVMYWNESIACTLMYCMDKHKVDLVESFMLWRSGEILPCNFIQLVYKNEGDSVIKRYAELLSRGASKYNDRNWEKANGQAEIDRGKQSAFRHFVQYLCGETDEDHIAAVLFNIQLVELVKFKMAKEVRR